MKASLFSPEKNVILIITGLSLLYGLCAYLIYKDILHPTAIILLIWITFPGFKYLCYFGRSKWLNPVQRLKKTLPRIQFSIESIKWKDEQNAEIIGTFHNETIVFMAASNSLYVQVWDPNWYKFSVKDAMASVMPEAVNQANMNFGPTIVISDPDNEGFRYLNTTYGMVLPETDLSNILNSTLLRMLNMKPELRDCINRANTMIPQTKRSPIGFRSDSQENK